MKKLFAFILVLQLFTFVSYTQNLQPFYENGKYGYRSGKQVIIQPTYEYAADFSEGRGAGKQNGKWGFVDEVGSLVVQPKYSKIEKFEDGFARFYQGQKFGIINKKGEQVVDAVCDEMEKSTYGLVLGSNGKKTWVSTATGKIGSSFKYADVDFDEYFIQCRLNRDYDIYTKEGVLIAENCRKSQTFRTSFDAPLIDINFSDDAYLVDTNGKKVSENFAYVDWREVNYYKMSIQDRSDNKILFCCYDNSLDLVKLVRSDGYMFDGTYYGYNYSTEYTTFEKDGSAYWLNSKGEMQKLKYLNTEEVYDHLILTTTE